MVPESTSDIGEFVRTIAIGDVPKAIGFNGKLEFRSHYSSEYFVWSFLIAIANPTDVDIQIYGRRWIIEWGRTKEIVPLQEWDERRFALSLAGGKPVVKAHSFRVFQSAIVTENDAPPKVEGELAVYRSGSEPARQLQIPEFEFSESSFAALDSGADILSDQDANFLRVSISKYLEAQLRGQGAIFRADRVAGLSQDGIKIINRFLIWVFREGFEKERTVCFDPIMPGSTDGIKLTTSDHYFSPKLVGDKDLTISQNKHALDSPNPSYFFYVFVYNHWQVNEYLPADASLVLELARIRSRYSFDEVQKELLRTASFEERARVEGMLTAEMLEAAGIASTPKRLSEDDLLEFRSFLLSNPWKKTDGLTPSAFIRQHCGKWLGLGLALAEVRAVQPNLATAYTNETHHDPSKRIEELYVRPHKLPAGMPPPRMKVGLRAADLSEAELNEKREKWKAEGARRRHSAHPKNPTL